MNFFSYWTNCSSTIFYFCLLLNLDLLAYKILILFFCHITEILLLLELPDQLFLSGFGRDQFLTLLASLEILGLFHLARIIPNLDFINLFFRRRLLIPLKTTVFWFVFIFTDEVIEVVLLEIFHFYDGSLVAISHVLAQVFKMTHESTKFALGHHWTPSLRKKSDCHRAWYHVLFGHFM